MPDSQPHDEKKRVFDNYDAVVEKVDVLTPRNKGIHFKFLDSKKMPFRAGQFVQLFVPVEGEPKPRRTSYSVASSPERNDGFELCVTLVEGGKSSTFIHHLNPGDKVHVMGPLGKFTMPDKVEREPVFIATGSGIAPFRAMISELLQRGFSKNIYLLNGNRYDDDIIYQKEWENLAAANKNFKIYFTLSRPTPKWTGAKGYVQDKIETFIKNPKEKDFYICGLSPMINDVQAKLLSLDVPPTQIHFERFD